MCKKEGCTICGIAGYIGKSKKPKVTYELISCLFDFLELRGTDAAGIWGTDASKKNRIIYHKEPIRSSEFIKLPIWQQVESLRPNLLLVHARWTSPGVGHARNNKNNHPFVSTDRRIGMVHNGRVSEADFLKEKYEIKSDTDSEVLLRMYEHGAEHEDDVDVGCPEIESRLKGLRDIWSLVHDGAMAVAIGERVDEDTRYLFLFRNQHRPLWLADVRDTLGQIFFFSSPDIWYRAVASSDLLKGESESMNSLIEIPIGQVWFFKTDKENPYVGYDESSYAKFDIEITSDGGKLWQKGDVCKIKEPIVKLPIISHLDDKEEVLEYEGRPKTTYVKGKPKTNLITEPKKVTSLIPCSSPRSWEDPDADPEIPNYRGNEHEDHVLGIETALQDISTHISNTYQEGSMTDDSYEEVISKLKDLEEELSDFAKSLKVY